MVYMSGITELMKTMLGSGLKDSFEMKQLLNLSKICLSFISL